MNIKFSAKFYFLCFLVSFIIFRDFLYSKSYFFRIEYDNVECVIQKV